jgi:4-amino-4-deoxy-L-arabinose transferase-like glycosyltransferase
VAAHWRCFDREHPSLWETSKLELSQDAKQYIQQADPHTRASPLHRKWTERTYFRPPLASYYFVGLFRAVQFDRMLAATAQAGLATLAYLLLFLSTRRVFGRGVALGTLAVVALHPVLMFYDVSFEDSTLAFALLSATIYAALWARDGRVVRWLAPGAAAGLAILARPNLLVVAAGVMVLAAGWQENTDGVCSRWEGWLLFLQSQLAPLPCPPANVRATQPWSVSRQRCCNRTPMKMACGCVSLSHNF